MSGSAQAKTQGETHPRSPASASSSTPPESSSPDLVLRESDSGILRLTLNRPEKRNALSLEMIAAMQSALDEAKEDSSVRVIVISAKGSVFSAGHDLKEITQARSAPDRGKAFFEEAMKKCSEMMSSIVLHPRPVIADVRGTATAAGCQLVASCDLAVVSEESKFATPGVQIGLFCSTPMVALSRKIGRNHAMEMLLTGDFVSAQRAVEIGLANRAVPLARMDEAVAELAEKIAAKSTLTVKTGKQAFYRQAEMTLAEAYEFTARTMTENLLARDAEEGISAFLEKRPPQWSDS